MGGSPIVIRDSVIGSPTGIEQGSSGTKNGAMFFIILGVGIILVHACVFLIARYCYKRRQRERERRSGGVAGDGADLTNGVKKSRLLSVSEVEAQFPYMTYMEAKSRQGDMKRTDDEEKAKEREEEQPEEDSKCNACTMTMTEMTTTTTPTTAAAAMTAEGSQVDNYANDDTIKHTTTTEDTQECQERYTPLDQPPTAESFQELASEKQTCQSFIQGPDLEAQLNDNDDNNNNNNNNEILFIDRQPKPESIIIRTDEVCSICIESMQGSDKVRLLTCGHMYHAECIDPWLTTRRAYCPLCKQEFSGNGSADELNNANSRVDDMQALLQAIAAASPSEPAPAVIQESEPTTHRRWWRL